MSSDKLTICSPAFPLPTPNRRVTVGPPRYPGLQQSKLWSVSLHSALSNVSPSFNVIQQHSAGIHIHRCPRMRIGSCASFFSLVFIVSFISMLISSASRCLEAFSPYAACINSSRTTSSRVSSSSDSSSICDIHFSILRSRIARGFFLFYLVFNSISIALLLSLVTIFHGYRT